MPLALNNMRTNSNWYRVKANDKCSQAKFRLIGEDLLDGTRLLG